jgi:hypothetical protein
MGFQQRVLLTKKLNLWRVRLPPKPSSPSWPVEMRYGRNHPGSFPCWSELWGWLKKIPLTNETGVWRFSMLGEGLFFFFLGKHGRCSTFHYRRKGYKVCTSPEEPDNGLHSIDEFHHYSCTGALLRWSVGSPVSEDIVIDAGGGGGSFEWDYLHFFKKITQIEKIRTSELLLHSYIPTPVRVPGARAPFHSLRPADVTLVDLRRPLVWRRRATRNARPVDVGRRVRLVLSATSRDTHGLVRLTPLRIGGKIHRSPMHAYENGTSFVHLKSRVLV